MPLTFPLTAAQFMQTMLIEELTMDCPENVELNTTGGGEQIKAQLAPMLWQGEARMGIMSRRETASPEVLLDVLRPAGRTFYVYDTRRPAPLLDPTGSIIGATSVGVLDLSGTREMRLYNLPAGYVLSRGDYLAWDYGSPILRRALHRVVDAQVIADGSNNTPFFEVTPAIRPGLPISYVSLVRASCKAVLEAGGVNKGSSRRWTTSGMSFRWRQTLA